MRADTCRCPECGALLRLAPQFRPGDWAKCPSCAAEFPLPDPGTFVTPAPPDPAPPRRPPWEDEVIEAPRRRWRDLDEDDDYPHVTRHRRRGDVADLSADYAVDLGEWFSYATAHWGAVVGPAAGYLLIYGLILLATRMLSCFSLLADLLLLPPLLAGVTVVALAQLRGERWTFGDFFSGFGWWGSIVLNQLLVGVVLLLCAVPALAVWTALFVQMPPGGQPDPVLLIAALAAAIAVSVLCFCLIAYFWTRLTFFALPLILDRNFGPVEAMQGSWELSRGHFWGLLGVNLLLGLLNLGGLLLLGIGLLFTFPLTALVSTAGYLLVAGTAPPRESPPHRGWDD